MQYYTLSKVPRRSTYATAWIVLEYFWDSNSPRDILKIDHTYTFVSMLGTRAGPESRVKKLGSGRK